MLTDSIWSQDFFSTNIQAKNPMYVVLNLGGAAETIIIAGLAAFAPKVLEEKFNMSPAESGLIMGNESYPYFLNHRQHM